MLSRFFVIALTLLAANHSFAQESQPSRNDFFGLSKLHQVHLEIPAAEWEAMQPIDRRSGDKSSVENSSEEQREIHKDRFPWAVGSLTIGGQTFQGVGVRYKGNATFALSRGNLKRNLKIKLDWTKDDQNYSGIETLNFNAGGMDPTRVREALSYSVFRTAGIPAPRTAYAEVKLTVPGKYDNAHLGIYVVVEQVNKAFLRDRFESSKGMLLKPQGVASAEYFGDDWAPYPDRYHPDDEPTAAQRQRLIEFARLVNKGTDEQFRNEIDSYLDVDGFLRYTAANTMLVNLDSPPAMGQNYYMYLHPKTNKFVVFPWDLDISMAGWPLGGTPEQQMALSLNRPFSGGYQLLDRLLTIDELNARYRKAIETLATGSFSKERLLRDLAILEKTVKSPLEREAAATETRNEPGYRSPVREFFPPDARTFVEKRTESIQQQLAGKSDGYTYVRREPPFGRRQMAVHIHVQGDANKDGGLSRQEFVALMEQWFDAMDKTKSGQLNKNDFITSLPDALFPVDFPHRRPQGISIPEPYVAEGFFAAADSDGNGMATKESLTNTVGKWFDSWSPNEQAQLERRQLYDGLKKVISMKPAAR